MELDVLLGEFLIAEEARDQQLADLIDQGDDPLARGQKVLAHALGVLMLLIAGEDLVRDRIQLG